MNEAITIHIGGRAQIFPSVLDALKEAKRLHLLIGEADRVGTERTVDLGKFLLAIRPHVKHGDFGSLLSDFGVHRRTASMAMKLAAKIGDGPIPEGSTHSVMVKLGVRVDANKSRLGNICSLLDGQPQAPLTPEQLEALRRADDEAWAKGGELDEGKEDDDGTEDDGDGVDDGAGDDGGAGDEPHAFGGEDGPRRVGRGGAAGEGQGGEEGDGEGADAAGEEEEEVEQRHTALSQSTQSSATGSGARGPGAGGTDPQQHNTTRRFSLSQNGDGVSAPGPRAVQMVFDFASALERGRSALEEAGELERDGMLSADERAEVVSLMARVDAVVARARSTGRGGEVARVG